MPPEKRSTAVKMTCEAAYGGHHPNPKPTPPPRTLNVKKFAESRSCELEWLHAVVSDRLNHDFKIHRSKRRRTTGYRSSKHNIRKATAASGSDPNPKTSRRVRRRLELQLNPDSGFVQTGDGTRRLRTHLWHAKRFTMVKRWGYFLPLGIQGRGKGSRAVLKRLRSGALVHDVSYCHPIQLEGPEVSILSILRMVLLPRPSIISEEISHSVQHGVRYNNAMLYHDGKHLSQFIAPVFYMWRPILNGNNYATSVDDHVSNGCCASVEQGCNTTSRQLWMWLHAAAFEEGFSALRAACQKQMHENGVSVDCSSLEGHIARLEVMGLKAMQILQKILHPISEMRSRLDHFPSTCSFLKNCTASQVQKPFVLHNADHLPSHAIFSLNVTNPRDLPLNESHADLETTRAESDPQEKKIPSCNPLIPGASASSEERLLALWSKPETNGVSLSDSRPLWDSSEKINPPLPENILCADRHRKRLKYFNLDNIDVDKSVSEVTNGFGQSCPILLLKHANMRNLEAGWSIVLPLSWAKAFWVSLVSHGAHAIGLRERRWIACDSGLPCFPYDFPDCNAYTVLMAAEAAASDSAAELRPPSVRPSRVPIPPPWDCIESTCEQGLGTNVTLLVSVSQTLGSPSSDQSNSLFHGFIPRCSSALNEHLKKIQDVCTDQMPARRGVCLVRVLVRAYKEGVFEDGAIVCAPIPTDLPLWNFSRSVEEESLQMPQSMIKSYFTQQDSRKWALQLPEDSSTLDSYRWPIGFITTGFVRGSKKPTAIALCEAKLLDQLREQQQQSRLAMQNEVTHEICVLVRNMRSAAYRCAFASIVLEDEEEDTKFM